jgi:hypothetical protein
MAACHNGCSGFIAEDLQGLFQVNGIPARNWSQHLKRSTQGNTSISTETPRTSPIEGGEIIGGEWLFK